MNASKLKIWSFVVQNNGNEFLEYMYMYNKEQLKRGCLVLEEGHAVRFLSAAARCDFFLNGDDNNNKPTNHAMACHTHERPPKPTQH